MRGGIEVIAAIGVRALINAGIGDSQERARIEEIWRIVVALRGTGWSEQVEQGRACVDVVGVEVVPLEIPAQTVIERQRAIHSPGVLEVEAEGGLSLTDS